MRTIWRILVSIRWPLLVFVLPPALLWAMTMDHAGGWVSVATLACLTLLWGAMVDGQFLTLGEDPRLALREDRDRFHYESVQLLRTLLGAASLVLSIVLLVLSWAMGVTALIGLVVLVLMGLLDGGRRRPRRFWVSELIVPVAAVGLPLAIASLSARAALAEALRRDGGVDDQQVREAMASISVIPAGVLEGVILFGLMLGGFVLLLLLRDQAKDAGDGYQTTPTLLGREASAALLTLGMIAAVAVASVGVASGVWAWMAPVVVGGGAMCVVWLHAWRADGQAAFLWALTQVVGGAIVLAGVL